jgi:hypothetical protein
MPALAADHPTAVLPWCERPLGFEPQEFRAQVQAQNVALFRRLHWQPLREELRHGRPHAPRRADLAHYPPCATPHAGFVLTRGVRHD